MAIKVGDQVRYVPALCYAMLPDTSGDLPFAVGKPQKDGSVKELVGHELRNHLRNRRASNAGTLRVMHPKRSWDAVVTTVGKNDEGEDVVSVDVTGSNHGVTLHCDGVLVDPTGKTPDTVHERPKVAEAAPPGVAKPFSEGVTEQPTTGDAHA